MSDPSHHPERTLKLPQGVGLSPHLFFSGVIGVATLLMIVLILIFSYRGNLHPPELETPPRLVQQPSGISAEAAIEQLNHQETDGILVQSKPVQVQTPRTQPVFAPLLETTPSADQALIQAARSKISVMNNFQGPAQPTGLAGSNAGQHQSVAPADAPLTRLGQDLDHGLAERFLSQNNQAQKTAFLKVQQKAEGLFDLDSKLIKLVSRDELKAGTIIPATLLTGIDSDLPGQITAQVSQNVYDTVTGNDLLIPQGTRVIGVYASQVAYGQSRVLIAWSRLIFPNGDSFDLQGQPGADLRGMAGLQDIVNNHALRIFGSALAFSMLGALGQLSQPKQAANTFPSNGQIIYGAIGQNLTQAGIQLTERNLNIQPTLKIRPGTNFNILLTRDIVLPGPYRFTYQSEAS